MLKFSRQPLVEKSWMTFNPLNVIKLSYRQQIPTENPTHILYDGNLIS